MFVFAITMENHGPLHLEAVRPGDAEGLCDPLPPGCEDLIVYLRHLANADRMIAMLRQHLEAAPRPTGLCFYGDHVPIMSKVYAQLGSPDGTTEYVIWNKGGPARVPVSAPTTLRVERLTLLWLQQAGLIDRKRCNSDSVSTPGA